MASRLFRGSIVRRVGAHGKTEAVGLQRCAACVCRVHCGSYLVNTGWTGGAYGVGERMSIKATRACIDSILDGSIASADFSTDPLFGFEVPRSLPNVPEGVCQPRDAWADKKAYDAQARKLAAMFQQNFLKYTG